MNAPFAYLSVMVSIILGLALAHLLGGVVRVINNRDRIAMYWPSLLWAGTLFLIVAQLWWADATLRTYTTWNFAAFLVLLAQPAALYVLCALILPLPENINTYDMRAAYVHNRVWFICVILILIALSFVGELVLYGHVTLGTHEGALLIFGAFGVVALRSKSEHVQKANAIVAAAMIIAYIVILFSALPGG
jgi:hypothetical protein